MQASPYEEMISFSWLLWESSNNKTIFNRKFIDIHHAYILKNICENSLSSLEIVVSAEILLLWTINRKVFIKQYSISMIMYTRLGIIFYIMIDELFVSISVRMDRIWLFYISTSLYILLSLSLHCLSSMHVDIDNLLVTKINEDYDRYCIHLIKLVNWMLNQLEERIIFLFKH